jgi:DNA (cytosine-5)-methyltransferase 1
MSRMNSPDTVVYNECANKVLKYAIKAYEGHPVEKLSSLLDGKPLPPPPKPSDIDCIIAGFPWCVI